MSDLTKSQRIALKLLGRGGARYGTRLKDMKALRDLGLAFAHDTGKPPPGQWTWRPTASGLRVLIGGEEAGVKGGDGR